MLFAMIFFILKKGFEMYRYKLLSTILVFLIIGLGGCASKLTGDSYTRDEARKPQVVILGTIEALRPVKIEGTNKIWIRNYCY